MRSPFIHRCTDRPMGEVDTFCFAIACVCCSEWEQYTPGQKFAGSCAHIRPNSYDKRPVDLERDSRIHYFENQAMLDAWASRRTA